jgi:type IV pilus assembly protein PilX
MSQPRNAFIAHQRGMVLVTTLLLLLVVTILAISMFRSFGIQERIAGNLREKQRALHAAESAQQYAEWWLSQGNGTTGIICSSLVAANVGQVCSNTLPTVVANVATIPWQIAGVDVGVTYTPPNMNLNVAGGAGNYYATPRFYISYLGLVPTGDAAVYQVDAFGYGGNANTVAVVESTYKLSSAVKSLGER